jgi:HEAT repeat protein
VVRDCIVDINQGVRFTYSSTLLRAASFAMFFMVIAFYILSYSVNRVYTQTFATEEALTSFFGGLTAATSIIALLIQLFVTNRTIERFGVRKVNLIFPVTTVFSMLALVFSFAMPSALLGSFNKDTVMPAFRNPVRVMFFNVLPGYMQGRARAMSVAIVLPLALLTCGILLWVMQRMEDPRYFLFPGTAAAILYFIFNYRMNRAYISTLLNTLKERLFLPNEQMYLELQGSSGEVLEEVLRGVRHEDDEVSVAFSRLLVDSFPDKAVDLILKEIGKKDIPTIDRMLRNLDSLDTSPYRAQLHELADKGDKHLQATVLGMLVKDGDEQARSKAIGLLESDNPRLRCLGIHVALQHEHHGHAEKLWLELLESGADARLAVMDLVPDIAQLDDARHEPLIKAYRLALEALLQEPATHIRTRALTGISRWPAGYRIDLDDLLVDPLDSEDPALRTAAAGCLHLVTANERETRIARALGDGHPRVREAALRSLQKVTDDFVETAAQWITGNRGNPRAQGTLLGALQAMNLPATRYETIAARKIDEAGRLQAAVAVLEQTPVGTGDSPALELVRHTLRERMDQILLLALQALEPLHEPGLIGIIRAGFSSGDSRHVANACEVLVNLGDRKVAGRLHDILEKSISSQTDKTATAEFETVNEVLNWCRQQKDDWLQQCADTALTTLSPGNTDA